MFEKIISNYESKKKIIEKNNGFFFNKICVETRFLESLKKNLRNLNDPLTKEILSGLNDVFFYLENIIIKNQQVAILHANQQIIEKETKQVKNELNKFYKEIDNWTNLHNELNEKLMVN